MIETGAPAMPLGAGSELVGRFLIGRMLGQGGMGTVYVARDATLGREVAIKLHHTASGAHRLRREAVAMARLAHPNVVTVFEVGEVDGRPFVVMEYVIGRTLRAWLTEAPRDVGEVLAAVLAAGEGLAAAHDAGLVHRDVKPENVLVGDDGRVRVGDFGLARELDSREDAAGAPADTLLSPSMTQTGAVLGTPAYMAPEQLSGAPVDSRADQFAYCVTAWEALWRERPFAGATFEALREAIGTGARRPPPSTPRVPARVRLALERGLAIDPAARFPSMHALLGAMRPVGRRRRWWLAAGAALAVAGALVLLRDPGPACDAAGVAELAPLRDDLPSLLFARGAGKAALQASALEWRYRATFRGNAHVACEAGRSHDWSPDIVAQSQACFAVTGRTAALQVDGADPARPSDVVRRLRRLAPDDPCRNQTYLASRPPIPRDPAQLAALTEARARLAVGEDAADAHDFARLRQAITAVEASPARGDPQVAAGLTVLHAWRALADGKPAETRKLFVDAYYAGRAIDDEQVASVALLQLIGAASQLGLERATVKDWLRTALADADRFRTRSPRLAGSVYLAAARAADDAQDVAKAMVFLGRVRSVVEPGSPAWIQSLELEGAVKITTGKVDDGVAAYTSAITQATAELGPDDPEVASLYGNYAASLLEAERIDDALISADRAMAIIRTLTDPDDDRIDPIRVNLGAVLISANRREADALAMLRTARANYVRRYGENTSLVAVIDTDLSAIYSDHGELGQALAALRSAEAIDEALLGPDAIDVAHVQFNIAAVLRFQHDYPAAIDAALRAAAIYGTRSPGSDRHRNALTMAANAANDAGQFARAAALSATAVRFGKAETEQTLAWADLEHGRALVGLGRAGEARPFVVEARNLYSALVMPPRVAQCEALLAKLPR
ncbi:MAG TPA: serine/threonine-protein kinase [Kofleriaceae bacterium]